ncbi:FAD-linked oxidoreductase [Atractiella rhizophila]|nr:FAD-linked oxidoreductase [Atractiella rhizophila]
MALRPVLRRNSLFALRRPFLPSRHALPHNRRCISHAVASTRLLAFRRPYLSIFLLCGSGYTLYGILTGYPSTRPTEYDALLPHLSNSSLASNAHLRTLPLGELCRSWFVYLVSGNGLLVSMGPSIIGLLDWGKQNIPVVGAWPWDGFMWIMKRTFFPHFVAGESAQQSYPYVAKLASQGVGASLNYSAEPLPFAPRDGVQTNALLKGVLKADLDAANDAILLASTFPDPAAAEDGDILKATTLAIKLTSFLRDPSVLRRATQVLVNMRSEETRWEKDWPESPVWLDGDTEALTNLYDEMRKLLLNAKRRGVRVLIDAEESWYQPAIDKFFHLLAEEVNSNRPSSTQSSKSWFSLLSSSSSPVSKREPAPLPTVYNTYQAYLKSTPHNLQVSLSRAKALNYSLGIKLVRGAYMFNDRKVVWDTKEETDNCWNESAKMLVHRMKEDHSLALVLATHNTTSARIGIKALIDESLVEPVGQGQYRATSALEGRLAFGQLMGMSNSLTHAIANTLLPRPNGHAVPYVAKASPYASVASCIPYLMRRANENRSILESGEERMGAREERKLVAREIRRRLGWTWET